MYRFVPAAFAAAAILAAPASAAVVSYTDSAAFTAATHSPQNYIFMGEGEYTNVNEGLERGPAFFSGPNLSIYTDGSYGEGSYLEADGYIDVALEGINAIGFTIGTWQTAGLVEVIVNGISIMSIETLSNPSTRFVGLTSDSFINSISFRATRTGGNNPPPAFAADDENEGPPPGGFPPSTPLFDIVSFQTALLTPLVEEPADVPEPAMLGLFGLGALGLGLSRRRK